MPTKSKLSKQHSSHMKWYVGVILVVLVALAGILVVRFSNAANTVSVVTASDSGWFQGTFPSGLVPIQRLSDPILRTNPNTVIELNAYDPGRSNLLGTIFNSRVQKGQTVGYCLYFRPITWHSNLEVISVRLLSSNQLIDMQGNLGMGFMSGEHVQDGYRKYCNTSKILSQAITDIRYDISVGNGKGYVWKIEQFIQGPFK